MAVVVPHIKKTTRGRRCPLATGWSDPGSAAMTDPEAMPSRSLERAELAGQVRAAVAELVPRQRTALELHQFHDRTYAEVAADLAMTPKAAKSLLYRARNQLREILLHLNGESLPRGDRR